MRLERGGSLKLDNVRLLSKHLLVSDYEPNGETKVQLNNSDLVASGRHGFLLQLSDAEDSLAVHHSTLDYPLAVWARVSDRAKTAADSPGGGLIEVTNSKVLARDPQSDDGIQFVAGEIGGRAKFLKLRLDTAEPAAGFQNALLFAGECRAEQVEGAPNRCDARAVLDGLRSSTP